MKLHGYCTDCRRIRRVTVRSGGVAFMAASGVPTGVCDECEEKRTGVLCPECRRGRIREHDRCTNCGLSHEDLTAADNFVTRRARGRRT